MDTQESQPKLYGSVLIKAKEIMDYLLMQPKSPTLAELSRGLNSSKSTTLKILKTMEHLGFVRREEETKRYVLGTQLIPYATKAISSFDIANVAQPYLEKLRDETGETINLGIPVNQRIVLVSKLESSNSIRLQSTIGGSMNMYSSAMGKAVLATYSADQLKRFLDTTDLRPVTQNTITNQNELRHDLKIIQEVGVAVDNEENEPEAFCLGAVLKKDTQLYGAFSISTPKYRMTPERRAGFIRMLLNTQHDIQEAI
ncbi:MAG: IclR family transcriptional regulator [Schleiferilactobacillus perolens]|jgi:DNA-binding IclR family transcriptional regulator|uniref:IclR family transcriptional regulator n=1 Tax=Schleiferilactobacillus perolens TaxID=100468 RepID=UPI0039EC3C2F|nr:IclR family transcriptional regulator [Schleiferilactobacillus harbinensis]